jgi:hypothetical protein
MTASRLWGWLRQKSRSGRGGVVALEVVVAWGEVAEAEGQGVGVEMIRSSRRWVADEG